MKNLDNREFELAWQDRFENFSVEPDESMWMRLDAALANEESAKYKKRAFYLQMVAAAAIIFAFAAGILFIRLHSTNTHPQLSDNNRSKSEAPLKGKEEIDKQNQKVPTITQGENKGSEETKSVRIGVFQKPVVQEAGKKLYSRLPVLNNNTTVESRDLKFGFLQKRSITFNTPVGPLAFRKKFDHETYETSVLPHTGNNNKSWAGINMGSGIFDPNISYGSRSNLLALDRVTGNQAAYMSSSSADYNNSLVEKPQYDPGITYYWGINFGHDFGDKWVLQTGIGYQVASSTTNVNTVFELADNENRYAYQVVGIKALNNSGQGQINNGSEQIELRNTYDFLSIPVLMGYRLYDGPVKWIVSGGISPVMLMANKIYNPDNLVEKESLSPGSDSPYKQFNLNGVLATTIGINLFNNYQLSISPSYNVGLGYLTKDTENVNFNSRPSYFMLAGNLSYIFN